jgi:hypothetical protein
MAAMVVSLAAMIIIHRWTWTETVEGAAVSRSVGWPWFTLIGASITLGTAALLERVASRGRPPND